MEKEAMTDRVLLMIGPSVLGDKGWGEDLWFCAQMVEKDWVPRAGYDSAEDGGF